jgi:hypothetical protein
MPKKRRGRPLKEIDAAMVRQLSMLGCSIETIAQHFQCSRDTIENRFRAEIEEGKSEGEIRIRGKLFAAAMAGSLRAAEVCAVNLCHWSLNKPEVCVTNIVQNNQVPPTPETTKAHLAKMQFAVREAAARQLNGEQPSAP